MMTLRNIKVAVSGKVSLSTYSLLMTLIFLFGAAGIGLYLLTQTENKIVGICVLSFVAVVCELGLFYMPMKIEADAENVYVVRSLWIKTIPYRIIESVCLCQPTMGEKNIFGGSGFMGHWGWKSDGDIGKYFAYYGKASDCFLVTLKDGKKYMLGCKNPSEMVAFINSHLD